VVRTYGNWRRPISPGLWGLGTGWTFGLVGGVGFGLIVALVGGFLAAVVWEAVMGIIAAIAIWKDHSGRPYSQSVTTHLAFSKAKKAGATVARRGPLTPEGNYKLPGIIGTTRCTEQVDDRDQAYALLSYPTGHHSVAFEMRPEGVANVDQRDINASVARWGLFLGGLSEVAGLTGAQVIIETAPDTGQRLEATIKGQRTENPPPITDDIMKKLIKTYPSTSATVRSWGTVSFDERKRLPGKRDRDPRRRADVLAESLSGELPHLMQQLTGTGAGRSSLIDVQGLCEIARVSYDPHSADALDAVLAGQEQQWSLDWNSVGPVADEDCKDYYEHDGCFSMSWVMTKPPTSGSRETVLNRLLQPTNGIMRKRVALLYRPMPLAQVSTTAEKDHSSAIFHKNAAAKPTARQAKSVSAAERTEQEVADGAGLEDFVIVSTVTIDSKDKLKFAKDTMRTLPATARMQMRPCYGFQAAAFALTLPFGFDPKRHMSKTSAGRK
jgi:hypothetical protein